MGWLGARRPWDGWARDCLREFLPLLQRICIPNQVAIVGLRLGLAWRGGSVWGGLGIAVAGADRRLQLPAPTALPLPLRRDLHNTRLVHVEIFDLPLKSRSRRDGRWAIFDGRGLAFMVTRARPCLGAALPSWLLGVTFVRAALGVTAMWATSPPNCDIRAYRPPPLRYRPPHSGIAHPHCDIAPPIRYPCMAISTVRGGGGHVLSRRAVSKYRQQFADNGKRITDNSTFVVSRRVVSKRRNWGKLYKCSQFFCLVELCPSVCISIRRGRIW